MKKNLISLTLLLGIGLNVFADHRTEQRSSCAILVKYKAIAKLKWPGALFYSNNTVGDCRNAHAEIKSDWNAIDPDGWSYCNIGSSGFSAGGTGRNGFMYGDNVTLISPELSYSPMIISKDHKQNNIKKNGYTGDGIVFDATNHTVIIKNLTAFLTVASEDLRNDFTTLQFKISTETVKDGQSIPLKTLWSAKASIVNGELLLEGDFEKGNFTNNSKGNEINYTLNQMTKTVQLDPNIDFETLVVEMSGDGGNLGLGVTENYAPNLSSIEGQTLKNNILSSTNFNFDVINKSKKIEINITKNIINAKIEEGTILTFDQKLVKSIDLTNNTQVVDISDLSSGAYFVRYLIDGNYYLKKFII